jgi:hypothetical protein
LLLISRPKHFTVIGGKFKFLGAQASVLNALLLLHHLLARCDLTENFAADFYSRKPLLFTTVSGFNN